MIERIDSKILDLILYGRVNPQIYAFETNTIPNYLKIGDTYRPISIRIEEWRRKYPDLNLKLNESAMINDEIFFRDYSVHKFLLNEGFKRITQEDLNAINKELYFSDEFFKNAKKEDIKKAINDIIKKYPGNLYDYYSIFNPSMPQVEKYPRIETFKPRDNQKETIDKFKVALEKNRNKLLMYAVMRFGKTVTSLWCAKEMDAKITVVVSGKADVREEWRKSLESHVDFGEPEHVFLTSNDLKNNKNIIKSVLKENKRIVLFFTLQDFLNKNRLNESIIKEKHKELFELSKSDQIDLLIVDETHYGARAKEFGKVLEDESQDIDLLYELPKTIKSKVTLHLSGTPYRILMGSEFKKDDIIAFYQYSDIVDDQQKWIKDDNNIDKDEWENPYYGFPEMIRFAFNLNKKSKARMLDLKDKGLTLSLTDLFSAKSINEDKLKELHKKFKFENEVLDFLLTIDHKDDGELLSFLDHPKIKDGKLCNHLVFVLPYRSSCDAMEEILKNNSDKFKNLNQFKILNISGFNQPKKYKNEKGVLNIKKDIELNAEKNQKTITLTVNRMLTGSTVKEWDTMIYLKAGYSPQEYDQATFRLQNPWVQEFRDENNEIIKFNMKPQTLLIDFDPTRMFMMVEEKSKIYNVNIEKNGNNQLRERIEKELSVSPLLWVQANKLVEVTPTNIIDKIREYSSEKSVIDEARSIPSDFSLLNDDVIRIEIERQNEIGSKGGLSIDPIEDEGTELEFDDPHLDDNDDIEKSEATDLKEKDEYDSYSKKIATLYSRILFFAFLTKDKVESLLDIINILLIGDDNPRIAFNLKLKLEVLKLMNEKMNPFILSALEYKIHNINSLSIDDDLSELERAQMAIKHFDRFSESEITTPLWISEEIVSKISDKTWINMINNGNKFLDVASKSGEFTIKAYEKMKSLGLKSVDFENSIVSIPTSSFAYEFTRKTYEILGLNTRMVAENFNSYKIVDLKEMTTVEIKNYFENLENYSNSTIFDIEEDKKMKFDIIVGNPPYQDKGGSGGNNDAAIYQHFVKFSLNLKPKISSMIIPARWFAAGRENLLGDFRREFINNKNIRELTVFEDASEVFKSVQIEGGVCYYVFDEDSKADYCQYTLIKDGKKQKTKRKLNDFDVLIINPTLSEIVRKVNLITKESNINTVDTIVSADTPFGIPSNPKTSKKTPVKVYPTSSDKHNIKLFHIENGKRKVEYVDGSLIKKNAQDIDKHKVFLTGAYGGHEQVLSTPELAPQNSVCSQSYLYAVFNSSLEGENFIKYLKTKFFRVLVSAMKITQSGPNRVYKFVPLQDFTLNSDIEWKKTVNELDSILYNKYKFTKEEIDFIENRITRMKDV